MSTMIRIRAWNPARGLGRLFTLLLWAAVFPAAAAGGAPDTTFSGDGLYTYPPECCAVSRANGVVAQPDGKSVYLGYANNGEFVSPSVEESVVVRLNADGTRDSGFADNGVLRLELDARQTRAIDVALQADGRIVVAGQYGDENVRWNPFVARLNANGTFDSTYAGTGIRSIPSFGLGETSAEVVAMELQADGKVLLAGILSGNTLFLARLDAAGQLDASFGGTGVVTHAGFRAVALSVGADGRIVVVGYAGSVDTAMRFTASGGLDASFDSDGIKSPLVPYSNQLKRVEQLADGRIVIGLDMNGLPTLLQLTATGQLDASFNGSGAVSFGSGKFIDFVVGADGLRYTLEWDGTESGSPNAQLRRFDAAGVQDAGWLPPKAEIRAVNQRVAARIARAADGSIFIATGTRALNGNDPGNFWAQKRLAGGQPDAGFGSGGGTVLQLGIREAMGAPGITLDPNGNIWTLRGVMCPRDAPAPAVHCGRLVVLMANGEPSPAFPPRLFVAPDAQGTTSGMKSLIARAPDGKLLYTYSIPVNMSNIVQAHWRLRRLNADGSHDATFAMVQSASALINNYAPGNAMLRYFPDGRIFFATIHYILRLLPDGAMDPTFNGGHSLFRSASDAILLDTGAFFLGFTPPNVHNSGAITKFTPTAQVDTSFGTNGTVTLNRAVDRIALLPDGKLLVAGHLNGLAYVMRLHSNGAIDQTFGTLGVTNADGFGAGQPLAGLRVQADGRIIIAGTDTTAGFGAWRGFVFRFNADGSKDTAFGNGGGAYVDFAGQEILGDMQLYPGGGFLLGGTVAGVGAVMKLLESGTPRDIAPASLPVAGVSRPYSQQLAASGGTAPYTYSVVTGSLPPGITLSPGGLLSGTPTTAGSYTFTVQATDAAAISHQRAYTLTVHNAATLVRSYYRTILGREPEAGGAQYWEGEVARMGSLGANVSEVFYAMAAAFFGGAEYRARNTSNAQYVTDLYRTFFNREPDAGGLAFWTNEIAAGKPRGAVLNDFLFSPEFADYMARIFGSAASSRAEVSMVLDFYRGFVGRLPDTQGFQHWVGRFRAAQCNGTVANEADAISFLFTHVDEYAARQQALPEAERAAGFVIDLYNAFLRRGGDRAGFQFWVDQINSGAQTREQVRMAFRDSPEFQARVQAVLQEGCIP